MAIASVALAAHAWRYLPIFDDDAFISLRYADRLLNGHGLTWTDGQRVEGYSNILWILLIAAITIGNQIIAEGIAPFEFTIPTDADSEINIALQPAAPTELVILKLVKLQP